ncbi:hypothetical protein PCIT_b0856 [Pseudoalteromonas citrea]|uniref:Orphan protein n=2 Tax=Pseudoalteromonas citrea TaxID=43655 RepID=A0AAD4AF23_9GAMM|nr:DUF6702 family protein [Pseudoalteromonas citrea]KAF7764787.1 hypothetical protein PCIT_b0856 [Pseudoalteromonas citrea]
MRYPWLYTTVSKKPTIKSESCTVLIGAFLLWLPLNSHAHQLKAALSTVVVNEASGELELTHRYYLHDVEHAVAHLFGDEVDIFSADQHKFVKYVHAHIRLKQPNGQILPLRNIGARIKKPFFFVYQQSVLPDNIAQLSMQNTVLRDVWCTQINMVNFKIQNVTRTLHFDGNDDWLSVNVKP